MLRSIWVFLAFGLAMWPTSGFPAWLVGEQVDSFDDSKLEFASSNSTDGAARLVISCFGRKYIGGQQFPLLRFTLFTARFLGDSDYKRILTFRIDDDSPYFEFASYSDKSADDVPRQDEDITNAYGHVLRMKTAKRIRVRATTFREENIDSEFDSTNFGQAVTKVIGDCR